MLLQREKARQIAGPSSTLIIGSLETLGHMITG
jgi:hypothetical protein